MAFPVTSSGVTTLQFYVTLHYTQPYKQAGGGNNQCAHLECPLCCIYIYFRHDDSLALHL